MDQRYEKSPKRKYTGREAVVGYEKEEIIPHGSVFQYEDGKEFKLDRKEGETDEEYQVRFKDELGK